MSPSSDAPEPESLQSSTMSGKGSVSRQTRAKQSKRSKGAMLPVQERLRQSKGHLAQLVAQSDRLARINRAFLAYLPPHLHSHVRLATLSADTWVIHAESAAWATRLRYILPSLQQQLSEHLGYQVPKLTMRIQPLGNADSKIPTRRVQVTEKSADVLEGAAEGVDDEQLGAALMRLAQHARQRAQN